MAFKDYFSNQSDVYAQVRPTYPEALFSFLSSLCREHKLVWDCATGNGQAALSLAQYFDKVIATDASTQQIANARQAANIEYRVASAEHSGLPDACADMVTVATAAHWFDLDKFYAEAERVLRPGGILAVWAYSSETINPEVDAVVKYLARDILWDYWPDESKKYVFEQYKTLPFPYVLIEAPTLFNTAEWNMQQHINYFMSWSGTQRYIREKGQNPIAQIIPALEKAWGNPEDIKEIRWPLHIKVGRKQ